MFKEHVERELVNDIRLIAECWRLGYIRDWGRLRTIISGRVSLAVTEQLAWENNIPYHKPSGAINELEHYRTMIAKGETPVKDNRTTIEDLMQLLKGEPK